MKTVVQIWRLGLGVGSLVLAAESAAIADCHKQRSPEWSDVSVVQFEVKGCTFPCPHYWSYWVKNSPTGLLSNFNTASGPVGLYKVSVPFSTILGQLKQADFFSLEPKLQIVSDVYYWVVSVQACGTLHTVFTTPMGVYSIDEPTRRLMTSIVGVIHSSSKSKLSDAPAKLGPSAEGVPFYPSLSAPLYGN